MKTREKEIALRIFVDVILIELAALAAITIFYLVSSWGIGWSLTAFQDEIIAHQNYLWLLVVVSPPILYLFGVYTYGRAYTQRYKGWVTVQAITWAQLLVGFCIYAIGIGPRFSWLTFLVGWLFSVGLLVGMRAIVFIKHNGLSGMFQYYNTSEKELSTAQVAPSQQYILVLGGAGYIGSVLVRQLLKRGYHVRVLDKLLFGDNSLAEVCDQPNFELIADDFRNVEAVTRAVQNVDTIVHLGAIVGDPACAIDEALSKEVNLQATKMVAEVGKGYGVRRFIFASSCSVYGASDELLSEQSTLSPLSLYARTKIESEKILLRMRDRNFAPVLLRFGTVYGLSPRPRFDLAVNLLTAKATNEGKITIFGGDQWRPFVHVVDIARAIVKAIEAPEVVVSGQIFNVGSNEQNYMISELGRVINEVIPQATVLESGQDVDKRDYRVSFAKIRRALNFGPTMTIQDGVREIQAALEGGQIPDYQQAIYNNYKYLDKWYHMPLVDPEERQVLDLTQRMVQLNGLRVGQDVQLEFINIRPGETLRKTLSRNYKDHENIYYLFSQQELPNLKLMLAQILVMIEAGQYEESIERLRQVLKTIGDYDFETFLKRVDSGLEPKNDPHKDTMWHKVVDNVAKGLEIRRH